MAPSYLPQSNFSSVIEDEHDVVLHLASAVSDCGKQASMNLWLCGSIDLNNCIGCDGIATTAKVMPCTLMLPVLCAKRV